MMIQLEPLVEVVTPKGKGYAFILIDYGMETDLYWVVAMNETGEIWTFANHEVRRANNITLGRNVQKEPVRKEILNEVPYRCL